MCPVLFHLPLPLGSAAVGTYGLFMLFGLALAIIVTGRIADARGRERVKIMNDMVLVEAGGLAGAVAAGIVWYGPWSLSTGETGQITLVSWGGILGGMAALAALKFFWKEDIAFLADIATPGLLAGMALGRVGCFFGGCCFGVPSHSCVAVSFSHPMAPASAAPQPLLPVQLISAALLFAGGLAALYPSLKWSGRGTVFCAGLLAYSLGRFVIEFWRYDHRVFFMGFSDGQLFALAAGVCAIAALLFMILSGRRCGTL